MSPKPAESNPLWPPYVLAAGLLALSGGFLLGGLLLLLRSLGAGGSAWEAAAAQAHGHLQLFGWGGLMVLGVGLHFLPRLVSVPLPRPQLARSALWLLVIGLVLRALCQPSLASGVPRSLRTVAAFGLVLGATLELAGTTLIVALLITLARGVRHAARKSIAPAVHGLMACGFASFWLAIFIGWLGALWAASGHDALITPRLDNATVLLGLLGFLVPVSLAMSARLFPLHAVTQLPRNRLLGVGAIMLVLGLLVRLSGELADLRQLAGCGQIAQALGIGVAMFALHIFEPRRTLPRRQVRVRTDPLQLHLVTAYAWLALSVVMLWFSGLGRIGIAIWQPPLDAERHALGAGFVTLLIFGIGSELLPGFRQAALRLPRLRWATLLLGNLAALLRVAPLLYAHLASARSNAAVMSSAGLLGALAIALFLINLPLYWGVRARIS